MKKEELDNFGRNVFWNNQVIDSGNQIFNFPNHTTHRGNMKVNYKLLSKICKSDCVKINYIVETYKNYNKDNYPVANIFPRPFSLKLAYQAKLTMTNFFANFGGLLSMYFGISMMILVEFMMKKLINIVMRKYWKILIIIRKTIKILLIFMMIHQVTTIIQKYIASNETIRIYFTNNIKLSKMAIFIEPLIDVKRNDEYYPNFNNYYESYEQSVHKHIVIHNHLSTLFWYNFTRFVYITRLFDRKIDCLLELKGNLQLDCGSIELSKIMIGGNTMTLVYVIPGDYFMTNSTIINNIESILIKVHSIDYDTYVYKTIKPIIIFYNSIFMNLIPNDLHSIDVHHDQINKIIVEPTYYQRLTHFGRQCDPRDKSLFDDSLTDDCIIECVRNRSIDAFNCIPFDNRFSVFRLKRDLIANKQINCKNILNNNQTFYTIMLNCMNNCHFDCELRLMKVKQFYDRRDKLSDNDIRIRIIPKSKLNVNYQQKYVMDGWELIYQLGGVVGMWAGWSVMTIHQLKYKDLFRKASKIIKYLKSLSYRIAKYLINLIKLIFALILKYLNLIRVQLYKISIIIYQKFVIKKVKRVKCRQIQPDSTVD